MPIEVRVDSLESVDEAIREDYVEADDGKFVLKGMAEMLGEYVRVDKIRDHPDTQGLVSALDKEREGRKDLEKQNRELVAKASEAMTPEEKAELATLRESKEAAADKLRRSEGEFDVWKVEILDKHTKETADLVTERDGLRTSIIKDRVSRDIVSAINEFGGRANILEPLIRQSITAAYEEGNVNIAVNDAAGVRRLDSEGKPLGIRGLVEGMSTDKEFGDLFASKQKSGGGSSSEGGSAADDKGDEGKQSADDTAKQASLQKTLDDGGALTATERLQLARLRGTAPTTEQIKEGRKP